MWIWSGCVQAGVGWRKGHGFSQQSRTWALKFSAHVNYETRPPITVSLIDKQLGDPRLGFIMVPKVRHIFLIVHYKHLNCEHFMVYNINFLCKTRNTQFFTIKVFSTIIDFSCNVSNIVTMFQAMGKYMQWCPKQLWSVGTLLYIHQPLKHRYSLIIHYILSFATLNSFQVIIYLFME